MFNKVLLATDGSVSSAKAALLVKRMMDSGIAPNITVLFVGAYNKEVNSYYALAGTTRKTEIRNQLRELGNKILDKAKEILGSGPNVEYVVSFGNQAEEIVKIAKKGYDLIVIGSRGLNPVAEILLGSVSSQVIQLAPCPVLVVKPED